MRFLAHILLAFALLIPFTPSTKAQQHAFVHAGIAADAERYEGYLKSNWQPGKAKAYELRTAGDKALGKDARLASRNFAMSVVADTTNAEAWLGLARALLAIQPDPAQGSERYDLPVNASGAAYRAYERAKDGTLKARALGVLAEALQRRSYWRPAIEALKTSLALAENADLRIVMDKLTAEHGFRMTDYKADTEAAEPRLCAQFSEPLARGQADFSKFVSVNGKDPQSVTPEGTQLCIEGLAHGQRYEVQLRAGLPSEIGETLSKQIEIAVYVPDRKPSVRFTGRSYVLPSKGQQGIPVVSVNTDEISVEIYRVGDRNLGAVLQNGNIDQQMSSYDAETLKNTTGSRVYEGKLAVASKLNEEITTAVPVSDAIPELKPGAYAMIARPAAKTQDYENQVATQWFIVSDLGLTALTGEDGIHTFVRSLAGANPVPDASVRLIARNNEVLATAKTNDNGYARFEAGLARGEGGLQPSILIAENGKGEYAFLDLTTTAFDLSDRGVKGREAPGPMDGYVYIDRGVYRPGEDVHLTSLVRDSSGKAASLPVTLIVSRPDGVEHRRYQLTDEGLGGRAVTLSLGASAMTGTWRAKLHTDPDADPVTQVSFLVEDFVPERLDMTLTPKTAILVPGQKASIAISGRYLYGPPAADLSLEGEIVVKASAKDPDGYAGYKFGLEDETISPVRQNLEDLPETGSDGSAELSVELPAITRTAKPLEADVLVRLREPGGRTIERSVTLPVAATEPRIGIKPAFKGKNIGEGESAVFDVVLLDAAGKPATAKGLSWQLVRLDTNWQWYSRDGRWNYEAVTIKRKLASGVLDLDGAVPGRIEAPVTFGRYRLEVISIEAGGPASSTGFSAGWYVSEETADSPEVLDVALDKPNYKPGDTAKLRIATKHGGKALIAVLGGGVHAMQEVEIAKGGGEVEIAVGDDWGPGAYATALLYRPMDEASKRMPGRAIGIQWLGLDQTARTLAVGLDVPDKIKPGGKLKVPVKLAGLQLGEEARITVSAVDVGILNLTRFKSPDPEAHFYAQRRLGLEVRDFYGRLIDGMRAERGKLRSGGDGDSGMALQGSPPVEATLALFSGIVKTGSDGTAMIEFDLPDFNGTVRLMAVAWTAGKLGHAQRDVIVRDTVALTASAPRFLTLGDEARLSIDVRNFEGPAGQYQVTVDQSTWDASGEPKRINDRAIDLKANERKADFVILKPETVGLFTYDVRVQGPDGIDVKRHLTFDVKPPAGDIRRTTISQLKAKGGKITLTSDLIHDLIGSRTHINLSAGPMARLDTPSLLTQLDRYPHGCAEQTVSRAMPLVYANAVAARIGIGTDKALKERVQAAIDRVFEMQDSSGAFGIWGPSNADMWLTSYVTDFLTRAKETGYTVNTLAFGQALDRLQNFVSYAQDFEKGGEERAYALYVLARNGRAPAGELRYYTDTRLDRFATPLAKAQLGAALAMLGDKERAETAFRAAVSQLDKEGQNALSRADYGSALRDGAALVTLAAETGFVRGETPRLADVVAKAYSTRSYTSTQEQAWMVLAAKALSADAAGTELNVGGQVQKGSLLRALSPAELGKDGGLTITNEGDAAADVVVSVIGAALTPEPAISKGFTIERSYYSLGGEKIDLASATGGAGTIKQNDRLVAVVKVETAEPGGRLILVDRLPAGFEIENPRLIESGDIANLDWLKTTVKPEHTEFRDDRFVAAFNLFGNRGSGNEDANGEQAPAAVPAGGVTTASAAYIVRAVTPGAFVHPAATVEDMYRPERYARTASGKLTVTAED